MRKTSEHDIRSLSVGMTGILISFGRYSGVRRKKGGNAYVPPALRRIVSPSQSNETPLPSVDEATQPTVKIEAPKEDVKQEEQKVPVVNVIQADTDKEKKEEKKENRTPEKLRTVGVVYVEMSTLPGELIVDRSC
jgi:hypothetical protein